METCSWGHAIKKRKADTCFMDSCKCALPHASERERCIHTHAHARARAHTHTHLRARQKHRKTHRNGREEEEEEEEFIASGNWVGWLRLENLRGNETRTRLLGLGLVRAPCIDSTSGFLIYYQYSVRALNGGSPFWLPSSLRESWCGRGRSLGSGLSNLLPVLCEGSCQRA